MVESETNNETPGLPFTRKLPAIIFHIDFLRCSFSLSNLSPLLLMWLTGLSVSSGLAYPATHTDHLSQEMSLQLHAIITKLVRTVKWDNIPKPWITSLAVKRKEWTVQWPHPPISPMVLTAARWRWVNHRTIKYWGIVYTTAIMNSWTNRQVPGHTHTLHTHSVLAAGCVWV